MSKPTTVMLMWPTKDGGYETLVFENAEEVENNAYGILFFSPRGSRETHIVSGIPWKVVRHESR